MTYQLINLETIYIHKAGLVDVRTREIDTSIAFINREVVIDLLTIIIIENLLDYNQIK